MHGCEHSACIRNRTSALLSGTSQKTEYDGVKIRATCVCNLGPCEKYDKYLLLLQTFP